jgi:GNAT superfamily N-acetyltransferase
MTDSPIRLARTEDRDRVASFMAEFYAESGYTLDREPAVAALVRLIEDESLGRLWLILHSGEAVGYIAVTLGFSLEYCGRDAFVDDFYIQAPFRGSGLGTRVLEAVEPECRTLGIRALHLEAERSNRAGQALYRRRGFRDNDRQLLSKRLSPVPEVGRVPYFLSHVAVTVAPSQLEGIAREELLHFYGEVLGWSENTALSIAGQRLFLRAPTDTQYVTVRAADGPMQTSGYEHLGFFTASEEELRAIHRRAERLSSQLPDLELQPIEVAYGGSLVTFRLRFRLPLALEVQYLRKG